jgi:hypothetical protein
MAGNFWRLLAAPVARRRKSHISTKADMTTLQGKLCTACFLIYFTCDATDARAVGNLLPANTG